MRLAYDIETTAIPSDGRLPHEVDAVHVLCAIDMDTGEEYVFTDQNTLPGRNGTLADGLHLLWRADLIVAHNGINFDLAVLQHHYGFSASFPQHQDTLVLSRLLFPNLVDRDWAFNRRKKGAYSLPQKLYGSHSLKAWGYRLGLLKDEYGEQEGAWDILTPEMVEYCLQDVRVTVSLHERLMSENPSEESVRLEHQLAELIAQQVRNGFTFDTPKAIELEAQLRQEHYKLRKRLKDRYGSWYVSMGEVIPKRTVRYKDKLRPDTTEGVPYTKVKRVEFNPASRQHIARVLKAQGWQPTDFTETGEPKVDETILKALTKDIPEAELIAQYLMIEKRLGQLADGAQAWLKCLKADGRIHGSVNTNGAVTGRATHSHPNVAQVPSVKAPYGKQCRELFCAPEGWLLVGTDASGLELRCLAHYMAKWDDGAYAHEVVSGDIHTANQQAAGLPTRDMAKTFIYGLLYGAGNEKIGQIIGKGARAGKQLREKFLANLPALKNLIDALQKTLANRGYLIGIDGRRLHVRSEHAALNTLLQSAGALICKQWGLYIDQMMREKGYRHGWAGDYAFNAWVHDEYQIAVRNAQVGQDLMEISQRAMKATEAHFNWRCPLDADARMGLNWAETH